MEVFSSLLVTDKGTAQSVPCSNLLGLPASAQDRPGAVTSPSSAVNKAWGHMAVRAPRGLGGPAPQKQVPACLSGAVVHVRPRNAPTSHLIWVSCSTLQHLLPTLSWLSCLLPRAFFQRVKCFLFFSAGGSSCLLKGFGGLRL